MSVIAKKRKSGTTYYVETWWNKKPWRERAGTDKREAERLDKRRKSEVEDGTFQPFVAPEAPKRPTVSEYSIEWGEARENVSASDDRRNVGRFAGLPEFGAMYLDDVRPLHVIAAIKKIKKTCGLAEKTIQNAYGALRTMFRDAQIAEFVQTNPCVLPRGFFGEADAEEREAYTRTECAILLAHHSIPEPIRVLTALCLLAGFRLGEAAGRRWRDLDTEPTPLWALDVSSQYGGRALKTKKRRVAPVHPDLQSILERWGRIGFVELTGHLPTPDDYIVPNISVRAKVPHHTKSTFNKRFKAGCAAAGVPYKTLHSTRHTMITLGRRGHADKAVLSKVTHNAKGDIVDRYTHRDWLELCEAVLAIGSLSSVRSTEHLPAGNAAKSASDEEEESTQMTAESHGSAPGRRLQFPAPPQRMSPPRRASFFVDSSVIGPSPRPAASSAGSIPGVSTVNY